jgi:hypothetical protein
MSRPKKIALGVLVSFFAIVAFVWVRFVAPTRFAVGIGAGMLAKQVCSCIYVAKRNVEDCRADQYESMDSIRLEVLDAEERVRAWVPGFGERISIYREGFGCTLE